MPRHESGPDLPGSSLIREEVKHLGASVGENFLLAIPLNNVFGTYLCAGDLFMGHAAHYTITR